MDSPLPLSSSLPMTTPRSGMMSIRSEVVYFSIIIYMHGARITASPFAFLTN